METPTDHSGSSPNLDPRKAAAYLRRVSKLRPALAIVLGSGFRDAVSVLRIERSIACARIPGFPVPKVSGHGGQLHFGQLGDVPAVVLDGRAHFYEGYSLAQVTFPVRVLAALGVRDLLLTNAAGGINPRFRRGDFMLLTDHVNFMGANPLRNDFSGSVPPFVDLTEVYDRALNAQLRRAARACGARLRSGVYVAVSGPSYETPAEIRAFAKLGADAVGMSTVPEAVVARHCGLRVAAVSCITNAAARRGGPAISHAEVLATAAATRSLAAQLLNHFAKLYGP